MPFQLKYISLNNSIIDNILKYHYIPPKPINVIAKVVKIRSKITLLFNRPAPLFPHTEPPLGHGSEVGGQSQQVVPVSHTW